MKKIISLLVVLAMLMSMAPMAFAAETTETTEYQEVTILEAIELAEEASNTVYLVRGTITEVADTTYGNMYIADEEGNSLYIYGLYSIDGATRFDAMETQPAVGDTVALLGTLSVYSGTAQMKNAKLHELNEVVYEIPEMPEYEVVTAPEAGVAYKFGMIQENVSATDVYYITGAMSGYYMATTTAVTAAADVYLEETEGGYYLYAMVDGAKKYVNMVVSGTYVNGAFEDAAATVYTFDAESNTIVATVNDTLYWFGTRNDKSYTTVGPVKTSYNGFYMQFYAEVVEEPETPAVEPTMFLGNNELTAGRNTGSEYVYVAEQTGTLYITLRSYTCNGVEYGEQMLDYGWSELYINDELVDSMQETLEVTKGDILTVKMTCDYDNYAAWLYLSYEGFFVEPVGSKINPIELAPSDCPTTTIEIPAGEEVYYALDYEFYEHVLYVYGENAYIAYEGWTESGEWGEIYVYAVDGVVTYEIWEYNIRIGNAGDTAATFELDAELPVGLESNPAQLVIGENVTEMTESMWGYHYVWNAEEAGTLTITVSGGPYWAFRLQNLDTTEEYYYWEIDNQPNTASVVVNAGDTVMLMLRLHEPVEWASIDGTLTVLAEFAPEGGSEGGEEGGEESGVSGWLHAYVKTDSGYAWVKINAATGEFEALSDYSEVAYTGAGQGNDGMIYAYVDGKYVQIDPNNGYAVTEGGADAYSVPINDATASAPEQVVTLIDEKSGEAVEVTVGGYLHYVSMDNWNTPYLVKLMDYTEPKTERKYNYDFEDTGMEAIAYLNCELLADGTYFYETYLVVNSNGDLYKLTEKTKVYDTTRGWRRSVEQIADLNLDVSNGASMTMLNETTAVIAANNASGVTLYTYDLTAGVLTELYTLAGATELVGLENYVVPAAELELGYNSVEIAAGEENAYTWTAETDGLFVVSMMSTNWSYTINGVTYTSADEKPVYMTIIEVAAGDVVTLNVGTADGTAGLVDFTANAYEVGAPIDIQFVFDESYTSGAINVDMPAGDYTFMMYNGSGMTLTVDGVVTEMTGDGWFDPITFNVTVAEAGIVEMTLTYPEGSYYNPADLSLGYNSCDIEEYSQMGYWYTYTAESDCLFALSMYSDNWFYSAMIQRADGTFGYPDGHYSDETDADGNLFPVYMQILELKAGDVVLLNFGTADYAAATVEFNAMVYAVGDPIEIMFIFDENYTSGAINVDMPAGDFTFMMYNGSGMTLTVDGVETAMSGDGWFDPITFNVTNAEAGIVAMTLTYPVGSYYNPAQLELGYNSCDIEEYSQMGYWYTYTAESDCLFALSMYSDNWFYSAMIQRADGTFGYPDGHYSNETDAEGNPINVTMQVLDLKAGDVVLLNFGTADYAAATVEFGTAVYAGTAEDPVLVDFLWDDENTGASVMADLPAGEYVYGQYRISGMALTVNGEAVEYVDGGWYGPCTFTINNETGNYAIYTLELVYPEGHMMNPDMAELGDNVADVMANNYEGYFFNWIAPEDGTLTVTVTSDGGWFFTVQNETQGLYGDDHWCDDDPVVNTETIEVKAGDLIVIVVGTFDPVTYERPAGQVNVNLQFTPKPDVVLGDVNGDGAVDTSDAKLIMQYDLGLIDETALTLEAADVNGDGVVDTTDAKLIMQLDLGLIEEF